MLQTGLIILGLANVSESLALFFWIYFAQRGEPMLGAVALLLGLLVERISVYMTIKQVFGENPPHKTLIPTLAATAVMEAVSWLGWMMLVDAIGGVAGHLIGFVVFSAVTVVVHSIQGGYIVQMGAFDFVRDRKTIIFSILEAAAGAALLILYRADQPFLAAVVLFVGISVEHYIQSTKLADVPGLLDKARGQHLPIA